MSSQKNNGHTKYANSNLNGVFAKSSSSTAHGSGVGAVRNYGGMLVLQKKTRPSTTAGTKLAVPKPEHAGNDPNTQLVPTGGAGSGWSKPEEPPAPPPPEPRQSSLTAGSTWASAPGLAWQSQRDTPPPQRPSFPVDRRLNPEEYPTLSATARAAPSQQRLPGRLEDSKSWADDERDVPQTAYRAAGPEWTMREERFDDERYVGDKPQEFGGRGGWEPRERAGYRYEEPGAPPPPPRGGGAFDDFEYDFSKPRGYDAPQPPPPPGRRQQYPDDRYAEPSYDGGRPTFDNFDDRPLFPPPPPPKAGAGARMPGPVDVEGDDEDPERKAFEEELARVAAELEKRKADDKEPELSAPQEEEPLDEEPQVVVERVERREVPLPPGLLPPPPPPQLPKPPAEPVAAMQPVQPAQTPEQAAAAAKTAALAKAKALKELAEEEERRRRSAAALKLKELEDRIASREAASKALAAAQAAMEAAATVGLQQPSKEPAAPTPSVEHVEDDWEKAPAVAVVEVVPRGSRPAQHAAAPPMPASSPTRATQAAAAMPPPPAANAWQQPMAVTARFGLFDDTLLENIAKSAAEEKAGAGEPWASREQHAAAAALAPMPAAAPATRLDATQDAEVPPPMPRDAWRVEDGEDDRGGRGGRTRGRGERSRGRGRADSVEGDRPGSARSSRENGSDSDGSRAARGRGSRSSISTRGGRPSRVASSAPQHKDDAGTATAMAAATAAMAAAAAMTGEDKRDKPAAAQDPTAPPKAPSDDPPAVAAAPAADEQLPAEVPADGKTRRLGKPPRDAAPALLASRAAPTAPASAVVSQPAANAAKPPPARGPSPTPRAAASSPHPTPPTVLPRQPSSPHPAAQPQRRDSSRLLPDPSKPPPTSPHAPLAPAPAPTSSSAPQNIPERRPSSASSDYSSWNRQMVKEVVSMSLDEPVTDTSVHLPTSLDPTPPKPAGPLMSPGFERQIGPRHTPKPMAKPDPAEDPLGSSMPPLPSSFLDTPIPPSPNAPALTGYPTPSGMQPMRPFVPTFNFPPPGSDGLQVPGGHLNMWAQGALSFGQPGAALQQHNIAAAAAEAWSVPPPAYPTGAAPSLPNAQPPLMNMVGGQFGQFASFGPPGPFNPPAFGTLAGFTPFPTSQPPFIPTGKQPDWSTGPTSIPGQNNTLTPGLGRPGSLDPLLPFASFPPSSDGFPAASLLAGPPGGLPGLGGPMFPPPPKQPAHEATMIAQIAGSMSQQRDAMLQHHQKQQQRAKDATKQVNLPDELGFGPDSTTSPKNLPMSAQAARAPPGLSLPGSSRAGPLLQHQHMMQQQQPVPQGGKPGGGRSRGPPADRAGRGPPPARGRGPPGPPSRRPAGGPPSAAHNPAGAYAPPAEHSHIGGAAPSNVADAGDLDMGGRGAARGGARGGRGAGSSRGGRGGRDGKVMFIPKGGNYAAAAPGPGVKPSFNGPTQAPQQKSDK